MAKTTTPAAPEQVVYVGPNIPGVVRQLASRSDD